jgi:hypothetical protein
MGLKGPVHRGPVSLKKKVSRTPNPGPQLLSPLVNIIRTEILQFFKDEVRPENASRV